MYRTRRLWIVWLPAILVVGSLAGCGPDRPQTVSVTGTVTLDGAPIEGATVGFTPEGGGRPATGTTDASGKFALTTFEEGDGALPGRHTVTISKTKTSGGMEGDAGAGEVEGGGGGPGSLAGPMGVGAEMPTVEWIVPQKYSSPKTSGLSCEVKSGMDPVTFDLTSQ
jgi:hypothetical protein